MGDVDGFNGTHCCCPPALLLMWIKMSACNMC